MNDSTETLSPDDPEDRRPELVLREAEPAPAARKRAKPGERRIQILQALAEMLEQPGAERITTAALAAKLSVSEAALYRHFASKAQMFEGLIEFIEASVFGLINQITEREADGATRARRITQVLLQFGEKNPGMSRVMVGDALVLEHERLLARMNQFFDKVEAQLRLCLREAEAARGQQNPATLSGAYATTTSTHSNEPQVRASTLVAFILGRLQRFTRSGFQRRPTEHLEQSLSLLI